MRSNPFLIFRPKIMTKINEASGRIAGERLDRGGRNDSKMDRAHCKKFPCRFGRVHNFIISFFANLVVVLVFYYIKHMIQSRIKSKLLYC